MTIEEAIKELRDASDSEVRYGDKDNHYDKVMKRVEAFEMAIKALKLPSVKPTRPKGVWLKRDYWSEGVGMGETYGYYYQCSECKKMVKGGYISCDDKFCSKCGAEMQEVEE